MTDDAKQSQMRSHVRVVAEEYIRTWYGERCPDFDATCIVCRHWAAFDLLTKEG